MEIIFDTLLGMLDACIILIIFTFLNFDNKFLQKNKIKSLIFILLYALLLTLVEFVIPQGIRQIFNIVLLSLLLSYITRTSMYASLISNALICIFFFTVELFVLFILILVLRIDFEQIISTFETKMLSGVISKILEFILAMLFIKSRFKIKKLSEFKKPNTLFQLLFLQTFMIAVLIMCLSSVDAYKSNIILYNIFIVATYLLLLGLTLIDMKERERLQAIQNRFKLQEEYISNIENILTIIRREKHDFANHLNTILAMCTLNKPDTVEKVANYIKKLSGKLINSYHFFNTGNEYVDGMLAVKSNIAFENDMELEVDFQAPLSNLKLNDCDITSIIGNITDNAFDAILASGEAEGKKITVTSWEDSIFYNISISNNGPVIEDKDIEKIFNSGYSTKSNNKSDHGFGLYIVQQLISKYNGVISVSSTREKTEFHIKFLKEGKAYGKVG